MVASFQTLPTSPSGRTGWPWTADAQPLLPTMPDDAPWPKISIVTPSFSQAQYLEETIRSVLLQGYPNLEYIIIDGGSTDGSVEIIKKYEPWLTYWVSEPDRGQSHAINKGFEKTTGEIIAWINSDDIYFPGVLSRVAVEFASSPQIGVLTGGITCTDEMSFMSQTQVPFLNLETPTDLTLLDPDTWFLPQASSFFQRSALEKAGFFVREDLVYTMDREILYRLVYESKVKLINDPLATYRHHEGSKTTSEIFKSFLENNLSFGYCTWGDEADQKLREKNKRKRVARGYYYEFQNLKGIKAMQSLAIAANLNPAYLKQLKFYKNIIKKTLNRL